MHILAISCMNKARLNHQPTPCKLPMMCAFHDKMQCIIGAPYSWPITHRRIFWALKLITLVHPVMLHIVGGMADRLINHEWSGSIQAVPTARHYPHHGVFCKPRPIQRPCPVLSPYSAGQFKLGQIGQLDSDIQWQLIVGSPVLTGSPGALFFGSSPYDMLMRRHGQEQKTQLVIKLVLCTSYIWAFLLRHAFGAPFLNPST